MSVAASTARLAIVPLAVEHAAVLFGPMSDRRLYAYIPDDPPASIDALATTFRRLCSGGHPDRGELWRNWMMVERATGAPVGTLQATIYADGRAEIGYIVLCDHWRRGLGGEGVGWLAAGLLADPVVARIEAHVDTGNLPSIRLLERLGFARRELVRDADVIRGERRDEYIYERRAGAARRVPYSGP